MNCGHGWECFSEKNTHLRQISIESCNLMANTLALLFGSGPFNSNSIGYLTLWDNAMIGSKGVTALKIFFKKTSSLTQLHLEDIHLGSEGIKLLSLELGGLLSLHHLILGNNNIGDTGLEGISTLCFSKLTRLHLGRNDIGRRGCEALIPYLLG